MPPDQESLGKWIIKDCPDWLKRTLPRRSFSDFFVSPDKIQTAVSRMTLEGHFRCLFPAMPLFLRHSKKTSPQRFGTFSRAILFCFI